MTTRKHSFLEFYGTSNSSFASIFFLHFFHTKFAISFFVNRKNSRKKKILNSQLVDRSKKSSRKNWISHKIGDCKHQFRRKDPGGSNLLSRITANRGSLLSHHNYKIRIGWEKLLMDNRYRQSQKHNNFVKS